MKASAVAETPPVISSMTPRSHVMSATAKNMMRWRSALFVSRLTEHGRDKDRGGEEDVSVLVVGFMREEELLDNLSADE